MPAAQQGGGGGADNSMAVIWVIAAIFVALGLIWFFLKTYIVIFFLTIKLYEVDFFNFISTHLNISATYFEPMRQAVLAALAQPDAVTFNDLINIGNSIGDWTRIPFVLLLIVLAFVVYFGNTTRVFRKTYNMNDFAQLERNNWPQISPVLDLKLEKTDIDKGPWAMAMTPMQFCKRMQLLEEVRPEKREGMTRREWDKINVVLKRGEANKVFALQLGPLWKGPEALPPHTRAIFAALAARINADSAPAETLFRQLNETSQTKLNLTGVDELLKKHYNTKLVQEIVNQHAYVLTVMASMLEAAREDGVQASADFLWIKPIDRKLWYTLNTVGRQTPFVEIAGVFAHWVAEKEAQHRLLVPMVEEATNAVELMLKEVIYKRDDD